MSREVVENKHVRQGGAVICGNEYQKCQIDSEIAVGKMAACMGMTWRWTDSLTREEHRMVWQFQ